MLNLGSLYKSLGSTEGLAAALTKSTPAAVAAFAAFVYSTVGPLSSSP